MYLLRILGMIFLEKNIKIILEKELKRLKFKQILVNKKSFYGDWVGM